MSSCLFGLICESSSLSGSAVASLIITIVIKTELHCMCQYLFCVQFCSVLRRHYSSLSVLSPSPPQNEVNAIKWDPTGNLLASCSDDMTLKASLKCFTALRCRSQTNIWACWSVGDAATEAQHPS